MRENFFGWFQSTSEWMNNNINGFLNQMGKRFIEDQEIFRENKETSLCPYFFINKSIYVKLDTKGFINNTSGSREYFVFKDHKMVEIAFQFCNKNIPLKKSEPYMKVHEIKFILTENDDEPRSKANQKLNKKQLLTINRLKDVLNSLTQKLPNNNEEAFHMLTDPGLTVEKILEADKEEISDFEVLKPDSEENN